MIMINDTNNSNGSNKNRIKLKANRNLYQDQITFISVYSKEKTLEKGTLVSDSEILRNIIDQWIFKVREEKEKIKCITI